MTDFQDTLNELSEQYRQRVDLHNEEKALTLRIKTKCRSFVNGDRKEAEILYNSMMKEDDTHPLQDVALIANYPFLEARNVIEQNRKQVERYMTKLVKGLPAYDWVKSIHGFGDIGFASIMAEAGDLNNYSNPSKLWKRFGLAVMPDGTRQRRVSGPDAVEHGYSPVRRSIIWTIGDSMAKTGGPYKELINYRKEVEVEKAESKGLTVLPSANIPSQFRGNNYPNQNTYINKGHIHNRAKRYAEKQLLKHLWQEWKKATAPVDSEEEVIV